MFFTVFLYFSTEAFLSCCLFDIPLQAEAGGGKSSNEESSGKENREPESEGRSGAHVAALSQCGELKSRVSIASGTSFQHYYKRMAPTSLPKQILIYHSSSRQIFQSANKAGKPCTQNPKIPSVQEDVRKKFTESERKSESPSAVEDVSQDFLEKDLPKKIFSHEEAPPVIPPSGFSEGSAPPSENDEEDKATESEGEESHSDSPLDESRLVFLSCVGRVWSDDSRGVFVPLSSVLVMSL